jgi:hypothetical protein
VYLGLLLYKLVPADGLGDPPAVLLDALKRANLDDVPAETFDLSTRQVLSHRGFE